MTNIQLPDIPAPVSALVSRAEADCQPAFARVEETERLNTRRVVRAFQEYRVAARHFAPTTGYGYDDIGRDTLSKLFAFVFETEDALVRPQIASGTHALALCLYGILRPGDEMLAAAGKPYDTLEEVIGLAGEAVLCGILASATGKFPCAPMAALTWRACWHSSCPRSNLCSSSARAAMTGGLRSVWGRSTRPLEPSTAPVPTYV